MHTITCNIASVQNQNRAGNKWAPHPQHSQRVASIWHYGVRVSIAGVGLGLAFQVATAVRPRVSGVRGRNGRVEGG